MPDVELRGLKTLRRSAGMTQRELADEAGTNQYTISELESGKRTARPSTLRRIAQALDVEVADLFREAELALPKANAAPVEELSRWFDERCGSNALVIPEEDLYRDAESKSVPGILRIIQDLSECNRVAQESLSKGGLSRRMRKALKEACAGFSGRLIALMTLANEKARTRRDRERIAEFVTGADGGR